jgi:hypothetical protein
MKKNNFVRFQAGIRHLVRIHEIFADAVRSASKRYEVSSIPLEKGIYAKLKSDPLNTVKVASQNPFGYGTLKKDDILKLLDNTVKTHLLNVITDENSSVKKLTVFNSWESQVFLDSNFQDLIEKNYHTLL